MKIILVESTMRNKEKERERYSLEPPNIQEKIKKYLEDGWDIWWNWYEMPRWLEEKYK